MEKLFWVICTVQSGVEWSSEKLKSACPSKKGKPRKRCKPEKTEEDIGPPCTEQRSYILPSQICPKTVSCCYIKMQVKKKSNVLI